MALTTGTNIRFSQIVSEFAGSTRFSHYIRGGSYVPNTSRNAAISASVSGLRLSQFRGTSKAAPGSAAWTSAGTYSFVVPPFEWIVFDIRGAGGGGGGSTYDGGYPGSAGGGGGYSQISLGPYASGGEGGALSWLSSPGKAGNGTGYGGNSNYSYGGGTGGAGGLYGYTRGGDGGDGGQAIITYYRPAITFGTTITITVGAGGYGGGGSTNGSYGSPGSIYAAWG